MLLDIVHRHASKKAASVEEKADFGSASMTARALLVFATAGLMVGLGFVGKAEPSSSRQPLRPDFRSYLLSGRALAYTPTKQATRHVYCFGDQRWYYGGQGPGWWSDGTSTGWVRQGYAATLSQRVMFDDSVRVMQSVTGVQGQPGTSGHCETVKAEIQPHDPDPGGGTSTQRAQLMVLDSNLTQPLYGSQPPITPKAGQRWWYGFAFRTNPGYVPHYDPELGNWNLVFSWHDSIAAPQPPIAIGIATLGPSAGKGNYRCGSRIRIAKLVQPRLEVSLTGGDRDNPGWATDHSNGTNTCRRYQGPDFRPGHLYRVYMRVVWSAEMRGALQVWIDGRKYADVSGVSTMWRTGSTADTTTYPVFENYRYYDASLPVNDVYYGGLIKGYSRAAVNIP